jgi:hypothetical protein
VGIERAVRPRGTEQSTGVVIEIEGLCQEGRHAIIGWHDLDSMCWSQDKYNTTAGAPVVL